METYISYGLDNENTLSVNGQLGCRSYYLGL